MSEPMTPEREAELRLYCSLEMQDALKEIDRLRASQAAMEKSRIEWQEAASKAGFVFSCGSDGFKVSHDPVVAIELALCRAEDAEGQAATDRARVKELEEAQRWRPIETVPRDGTRVLIGWFELPGQRTLAIAGWNSTLKAWSNTWMAFSSDPRDQPTHWMPLPQTPVDPHATQSGTVH